MNADAIIDTQLERVQLCTILTNDSIILTRNRHFELEIHGKYEGYLYMVIRDFGISVDRKRYLRNGNATYVRVKLEGYKIKNSP